MCLGRLFDPKDQGLLLALATSPTGEPAAMCQFVPPRLRASRSTASPRPGGSPERAPRLRALPDDRAPGRRGREGPQPQLREFRSILDGERGEGLTTRTERWALKRLSGIMPIESLWRFNAKYEPVWLPRYLVFPAAESLVPVVEWRRCAPS